MGFQLVFWLRNASVVYVPPPPPPSPSHSGLADSYKESEGWKKSTFTQPSLSLQLSAKQLSMTNIPLEVSAIYFVILNSYKVLEGPEGGFADSYKKSEGTVFPTFTFHCACQQNHPQRPIFHWRCQEFIS